ncbi:unnamed protein product [Ectocarpus sp. 12 AP-2014]
MGEKLSSFDQWDAIIGRRSTEERPVRKDLVLERKSYGLNSDDEMVKLSTPGGAYIYDGWKVMLQQRCSLCLLGDIEGAIPRQRQVRLGGPVHQLQQYLRWPFF